MQTNLSKRRVAAGGAFIAAVAGTVVAVNPAASADVMGVIQSAVTCTTTAACVSGTNTKAGPGVAGTSNSNVGVKGISNGYYGVSGSSNKSYGVAGSAGSSAKGGVLGSAAGVSATGVLGTNSTGGYGVYGLAAGASGTGVLGTTTNGSGFGVRGSSSGGIGTYGSTDSGAGVYGAADESGVAVYGSANQGYGVEGITDSSTATSVYGYNYGGDGAEFHGTYIGVQGWAPASGGYPFVAFVPGGRNVFQVTGAGDINYAGTIAHYATLKSGALVKSYAPVSSAPTLEDTGSAQLVAGAATIRLDPTFAASIDGTAPYHVFLTPDGDTRGLYVAARTPTGFVVRETQGGRATLTFDYRIIAAAQGQANQRMAVVNASEFARAPLTTAPNIPSSKPSGQLPAPPQP